ncbi:MAG TPA: hypothetical protein VHP14_23070 [Anaerolineales bacterium]|nr:hypothetical protein [Anaerolineales bacterium]
MNKRPIPAAPDENKIEELLTKIQPVPGEHFYQTMDRANWRIEEKKGVEMNARNRRVKVAVAMTIVILIASLIVTPQGRAFAQNILQFFNRAESDQLPPLSWQLTPFPTQTIPAPTLSVANAEEQIGFDIREFIAAPAGLTLQGARLAGKTIYIDYASDDGACRLTLAQALNSGDPNADIWKQFAAADMQAVQVGEFSGELVHDPANATVHLRWQQPDDGYPPPALIASADWQPGTLALELIQSCTPDSPAYLSEESLIRLAQKTVHTPYADPLMRIEQAESQVGFKALQLSEENSGNYTLAGASIDSQYRLLTLVYHSPDGSAVQSGRGFTLKQWPTTEPVDTCDLCAAIGASAQVETISVRGMNGEYVQGVWVLTNDGPSWQPVPQRKVMRWQENGYWFELGMFTSDGSHTVEDLITIAEELR